MKKYNDDFTTIPAEIYCKIAKRVGELKCDTVFVCRLNNHQDDYDKLFMVIGKYKTPSPYFDGQYALWTVNMYGDEASLCFGHYHISFKGALEIVAERVRDLNEKESE